MAEHARTIFGTDLAMSITGLAGPEGDGVHTVGTLFVALATPDGTFHRTLHKDKWGRVRIKHAAANHAFDMVRRYLTGPAGGDRGKPLTLSSAFSGGRGSCPGRVVTHA